MKTRKVGVLIGVLVGVAALGGVACAEDHKHANMDNGPTVLQVVGGGYLQNGYKCGIAAVKKESGAVEGTVHCKSVITDKKYVINPIKREIDCDPVGITASCPGATTATITCRNGSQVDVVAGVDGDPTNNGAIAALGWGKNVDFPLTQVLHGIVKVECK